MEYGRLEQINDLKEKGWKEDRLTDYFHGKDRTLGLIGSPTYLRSIDGRYYACSCGRETLKFHADRAVNDENVWFDEIIDSLERLDRGELEERIPHTGVEPVDVREWLKQFD